MSFDERHKQKAGAALDDAIVGISVKDGFGGIAQNKMLLCAAAALVVILAAGIWFLTRPKEQAKAQTEEAPAVLTVTTLPVQEKIIDRHIAVSGSVSA